MSLAGTAVAQAEEERTIYSGVYTQEQADRGKAAYGNSCAVCHGPTGGGGPDAPGIIGYVFNQKYDGAPLIAYFDYMRSTMPAGRAGSLPRQTYTDITAFLLSSHGAPAGDTELSGEEDALAEIYFAPAP